MIQFDNGPTNGDYARYIDELMQRAAVAASAGILTDASGDASRRPRPAATASQNSSRAVATVSRRQDASRTDVWGPGAASPSPSSQSPSPLVQSTGFVMPTVASDKASAAAAVAMALMNGEMGPRSLRTRGAIVAAVVGALLLFVGLVVPLTFSSLLIAGGVVLLTGAFRMIKNALPRASAVGSTRT